MSKKKKRLKVGDVVFADYGVDQQGQHWWRSNFDGWVMHGPFRTRQEPQRNSENTLFGPKCKFHHGGQWAPAWERPQ